MCLQAGTGTDSSCVYFCQIILWQFISGSLAVNVSEASGAQCTWKQTGRLATATPTVWASAPAPCAATPFCTKPHYLASRAVPAVTLSLSLPVSAIPLIHWHNLTSAGYFHILALHYECTVSLGDTLKVILCAPSLRCVLLDAKFTASLLFPSATFVAMAKGFRNLQAVKTNVVLLGLLTLPDESTVSSQRRHPSLNKTASHPTNTAESTSNRNTNFLWLCPCSCLYFTWQVC